MSTIITKEIEIDMGHRIPNHKSKCKNLHGHRYKIQAGVIGSVQNIKDESDEGMVLDFGDLKQVMNTYIHDVYDHGFMFYKNDFFAQWFNGTEQNIHLVSFIPTAENLAEYWFKKLEQGLYEKNSQLCLYYVTVWETPTSTATYKKNE